MSVFRTKTTKLNHRGDTIVEVLISIAVASLVLAGAYAISNRNVASTQDTQEHSQALLIAQRQIEGLRALAQDSSWSGLGGNSCVIGATPALAPAGACNLKSDGSTGCSAQPCYRVTITSSSGIYEVKVAWTSVLGGNSQITMVYGI